MEELSWEDICQIWMNLVSEVLRKALLFRLVSFGLSLSQFHLNICCFEKWKLLNEEPRKKKNWIWEKSAGD